MRVSVRVQGKFHSVLVGNPAFGAGKVDGVSCQSPVRVGPAG